MKLFYNCFALLILISALSGCRKAKELDEIDQKYIWANYEMIYDSGTDITTVKANFRHLSSVGRQLKLTGSSNVRFNNELLPEVNELLTNATYYQKEYAGMIEQGAFTWTDADGVVYNNIIHLRTADVPDNLTEISTGAAYELFWEGDHLIQDERLRLKFQVQGGSNKTYTQNSAFTESVIIPLGDLEGLAPAYAELAIERRYRTDLQEKTVSGGRITAEYFSIFRGVDLTD